MKPENYNILFDPWFWKLQRYRDDHWGAIMQDGKYRAEAHGKTPEHALQVLKESIDERRRTIAPEGTGSPSPTSGTKGTGEA